MSLIGWELVCGPKDFGGLGLMRIRTVNKSLLAKQIQRTFTTNSEWNSILKSKYFCQLWFSKFLP